MDRRRFLRVAGSFVASAGVSQALGCVGNEALFDDAPGAGHQFLHGVASGDPRPDSVVLWTRVEPADGGVESVRVRVEVSHTETFDALVLRQELHAEVESDFTLRLWVDGLEPATRYYYRFGAGGAQSRIGRTRTAPSDDADVRVRIAWASCQDYTSGFYGAYRRLLHEDRKAPSDQQLDFVLHVGDFIYETIGDNYQRGLDDELRPQMLVDRAGVRRLLTEFPEGGRAGEVRFAKNADDYRHLYKTVLRDPDLQEARARWPFVCVWDDHEFSNDAWQTQANYTGEATADEPSQQRRVAANQAWFEYIPAALSELGAEAQGFVPVQVRNAPYSAPNSHNRIAEPNNLKALESLVIYRTLRWGRHVQLILTDLRSYRSDHAVPEELVDASAQLFHARLAVPLQLVNVLDAGKTAHSGQPPDQVRGLPNPRKTSPTGTMLGKEQKAWLKRTLKGSSATWKLWGCSVPLMRLRLDSSDVPLVGSLIGDLVLSADAWDGYPNERRELMRYLRDEKVTNVVAMSGDHHAHFAGLVMDDHDGDAPEAVIVEFSTAGISSNSLFAALIDGDALPDFDAIRRVVTYDSTPLGGKSTRVPNLNTLLRYGSGAANKAADTHDLPQIEAARRPEVNPHLRYADTHARGFGRLTVSADTLEASLVTIEPPIVDRGAGGAKLRGEAKFRVRAQTVGSPPELDEPQLHGKSPFPLGGL